MRLEARGRMFADRDPGNPNDPEFFAHGIGAMRWSVGPRYRWLEFLAPDVERASADGNVLACICTTTDGANWSCPGDVSGWDGNVEKPTFSPSIWLRDRKGWHGYIRNGDLYTA